MNFKERYIPSELKDNKQWVVYFKKTDPTNGHTEKIMVSPNTYKHARSNEPKDWTNFFNALMCAYNYRNTDGLAYVLTHGLVFVDLDHSVDENGEISEFARNILNEFPDTYAERSCSGHGIHLLMKGHLPENMMKRNDEIGLELYDTKRFVCMTGNVIGNRCHIQDYSDKIRDFFGKYLGIKEAVMRPRCTMPLSNLNDMEIIEKAKRSRTGDKFMRLYSGDVSGYVSQSSADLALVAMIAFYTQNPSQIDSIFRSSGLMREKWDSKRGNTTYGEMTIDAALRSTRRVFHEYEM